MVKGTHPATVSIVQSNVHCIYSYKYGSSIKLPNAACNSERCVGLMPLKEKTVAPHSIYTHHQPKCTTKALRPLTHTTAPQNSPFPKTPAAGRKEQPKRVKHHSRNIAQTINQQPHTSINRTHASTSNRTHYSSAWGRDQINTAQQRHQPSSTTINTQSASIRPGHHPSQS